MVDVYISSTFRDLEEARAQVRQTVRRMQHVDVAMEYYGASDERPLDKCLGDVAACDLYICVVAWRYGFVPDGQTKSITELEYRKAVESGKPRLVFLLDEDARWPKSQMEFGAMAEVERFRADLERDTIVDTFTDEDDLGEKVAVAIHKWQLRQGHSQGVADWESYRRTMFELHRWVKLAVIAGAKQDRRLTEIPLTDVFVPQPVQGGSPEYEVPEDLPRPVTEASAPPSGPMDSGDGGEDEEISGLRLGGIAGVPGASLEQIWGVLARERRQIFLGAPGSGKSTLLLDAVLQLCDTGRGPEQLPQNLRHTPLPFLVELRQYVLDDTAPDFVSYIAANVARRYGVQVDIEQIKVILHEDDRALVMFDGLDEVFDAQAQSEVIDEFRRFARTYAGCRLVVTSRIAGYEALELERDGFRHYTVLGFGMPEIREFVPKWYEHYTWQGDERDAHGLLQRISESPRLLELAGNPLLLTMMAVIYKHHDLPEKRLQLYKRCSEVLLEDWEVKRKRISRQESLPLGFPMVAEQKEELLQQVAMYMLLQQHAGSELNLIAREPLLDIIASYLRSQYKKSPGEARAVASEILDHLRERTFVIAEVGDKRFGFVHRTFMEYFAALHCKAEFNRREADYNWLTRELFERHWRQSEWREVLLLLIAMLKEQDSPVRKVIDHVRWQRVDGVPVHLGFAARCLAEVGTVDDEWSKRLLNDLVVAMCRHARSDDEAAVAFLNDALGSFSVLASTVTLGDGTRSMIDELGEVKALRGRMVAFQLQLALRSREERRAYAVKSLNATEEAVRRGAVAALEREWAGREDAGDALADVLRKDRQSRVRLAALQALERGWPGSRRALDAIGERVGVETAYSVVIDMVLYLARHWAGDQQAFKIVLGFCRAQHQLRTQMDGRNAVRDALAASIVRGWQHMPGCAALLRQYWKSGVDGHTGAPAIIALVRGWPDDTETMDWVRTEIMNSPPSGLWKAVLAEVLRLRPNDAELAAWARGRAEDRRRVSALIRLEIVDALQIKEGDKEGVRWLERVLTSDPVPWVRRRAMSDWVAVQADPEKRAQVLVDRMFLDTDTEVQILAFSLLAETAGQKQILRAARTYMNQERSGYARRSVLILAHDHSRAQAKELLIERLKEDTDDSVRLTALICLRRLDHALVQPFPVHLSLFLGDQFEYLVRHRLLGRGRLLWGFHKEPRISESSWGPAYGYLVDAAADPSEEVRLIALEGLFAGAPYYDLARTALERRAVEESDAPLRGAIAEALERLSAVSDEETADPWR